MIARGLDKPADIASFLMSSKMFNLPDVKRLMYTTALEYHDDNGCQLTNYILSTIATKNVRAFKVLSPYGHMSQHVYDADTLTKFFNEGPCSLKREIIWPKTLRGTLYANAWHSTEILSMFNWHEYTTRLTVTDPALDPKVFEAVEQGNVTLYDEITRDYEPNDTILAQLLISSLISGRMDFLQYFMRKEEKRLKGILANHVRQLSDQQSLTVWTVALHTSNTESIQLLLDCYNLSIDECERLTYAHFLTYDENSLSYLFQQYLEVAPNWMIAMILKEPALLKQIMPRLQSLEIKELRRWMNSASRAELGTSRYILLTMHPEVSRQRGIWRRSALDIIYDQHGTQYFPEAEILPHITEESTMVPQGTSYMKLVNFVAAVTFGHANILRKAIPLLFQGKEKLKLTAPNKLYIMNEAIKTARSSKKGVLCLKMLLDAGVVNANDKVGGGRPIDFFCGQDLPVLLELFLEHGARMDIVSSKLFPDFRGDAFLLRTAIDRNSPGCVSVLLNAGARPSGHDLFKRSVSRLLLGLETGDDIVRKCQIAGLIMPFYISLDQGGVGDSNGYICKNSLATLMTKALLQIFRNNKLVHLLLGVWIHGVSDIHISDLNGGRLYHSSLLRSFWDLLFTYRANSSSSSDTEGHEISLTRLIQCSFVPGPDWQVLQRDLKAASSESERRTIALDWLRDKIPKRISLSDVS